MKCFPNFSKIFTNIENKVGKDGFIPWNDMPEPYSLNSLDITINDNKNVLNNMFQVLNSFFNDEYFDISIINDILYRMGLKNAKLKIDFINGKYSMKIKDFLNEVKLGISNNEILMTGLMATNSNNIIEEILIDYKDQIIDSITYSYVLHIIIKCIIDPLQGEYVFDQCFNTFNYERENGYLKGWESKASLFEKFKVSTIDPVIPSLRPKFKSKNKFFQINKLINGKAVENNVAETMSLYTRAGLSFNILEACVQDLSWSNDYNAKAGFELAMPDGLADINKFINQFRPVKAYMKSSMYRYSPFPKNWSDLYNAWNLVFVSNYHNFPYFMAKLLTPMVGTYYHENPSEYMYYRLIGLWLHIHFIMRSYVEENKLENKYNWTKILKNNRKIFGHVTYYYSQKYRACYDLINKQSLNCCLRQPDNTLDGFMRGLWKTLEILIENNETEENIVKKLKYIKIDINQKFN